MGYEQNVNGVDRTLTCNQTVMSGLIDPKKSDKSGVFRYFRRRSFTSVHGVSVVKLWSVLATITVSVVRFRGMTRLSGILWRLVEFPRYWRAFLKRA